MTAPPVRRRCTVSLVFFLAFVDRVVLAALAPMTVAEVIAASEERDRIMAADTQHLRESGIGSFDFYSNEQMGSAPDLTSVGGDSMGGSGADISGEDSDDDDEDDDDVPARKHKTHQPLTNYTKQPGVWYISLTNFKNTMFYGTVHVGTPLRPYTVMFATGSGDTWLPSSSCTTMGCVVHTMFDHHQSKSYQAAGSSFNLTYGEGKVHGKSGKDVVDLGGAVFPGAFAELTEQDRSFNAKYKWYPFDGIVGLSYAGAAVSRQEPLFDTMMARRLLKQNIFSLYLTQSPGRPGSTLILGGTDSRYHLDEVSFFPVEEPFIFWMVNVSGISLRESSMSATSALDRKTLISLCENGQDPDHYRHHRHHKHKRRGCRAVIDSGTSLISGPSVAINKLARYLSIDPTCKNVDQLPVLSFQFYGRTYSLHPEDYVMRIKVRDSHACFLGLNAYDFPAQMGPLWVLGNTFLRKYYTVFDRTQNQIGFAMARPM